MKYFPPETFVYVATHDIFYAGSRVKIGGHLITNTPPPAKQWKLLCPVAEFETGPDAKIIEDVFMAPEDGVLGAVYNAREQLKAAMSRGNGGQIGEARMAVDAAELALRKYWERVKTDDTRKDEPILDARVEGELAAAAVDMAESDLRQTLAAQQDSLLAAAKEA